MMLPDWGLIANDRFSLHYLFSLNFEMGNHGNGVNQCSTPLRAQIVLGENRAGCDEAAISQPTVEL